MAENPLGTTGQREPLRSNDLLARRDHQFSCRETVRELWAACSDRQSWLSGLTDRIAKRLTWLATQPCDDWDQTAFEGAMEVYGVELRKTESCSRKIDEERGMMVELADVCEACDGSGVVREINSWSVDTGTKWQRNFSEEVNVECPECDGDGYS